MIATEQEAEIPKGLAITDDEYHKWRKESEALELSDECFEKLYQLKGLLEKKAADFYISDRRWKKTVKLLKASAYFNGRETISPLDLLLLKDCLWHSPESREMVYQVIHEFAIKHAFEQDIVSEHIASYREQLLIVQEELEAQLSMTLIGEATNGILRRRGYFYSTSEAKQYSVEYTNGLIKLVLLQNSMPVSESAKGNTHWVYVAKDELQKVIQQGGGEVYGFVNQNTDLCCMRFDIDADDRLVIKDISSRPVLVAMVTKQGLEGECFQGKCLQGKWYQAWRAKADQATAQLNQAEYRLRQVRSHFHSVLPHSFIDIRLLTEIESGLQLLMDDLESVKRDSARVIRRINNLKQFFS